MLDIALRPIKDRILIQLCKLIPLWVTPDRLTIAGFLVGLSTPVLSSQGAPRAALSAWLFNRLLDGLDGSVARSRRTVTGWGGYLDILCDFIIYSLIPIGVALSPDLEPSAAMMPLAALLASLHVNNAMLFYLAAALPPNPANEPELTSIRMLPALVEGSESFIFFCALISWPDWFPAISCVMASAVTINIVQRTLLAKQQLQIIQHNKRA